MQEKTCVFGIKNGLCSHGKKGNVGGDTCMICDALGVVLGHTKDKMNLTDL
ncbi:MAG: hypothetical protein IPL46_04985 [Saprospiraceae bacterium]|nr:hypothetical protein [Saprospiraceae bacterium]